MTRAVVLQVPDKFYEVLPIFYEKAKEYNIFNKFYVWTNKPEADILGSDMTILESVGDWEFCGNMRKLIKIVKEDIFVVCCEDHIATEKNELGVLQKAFDFVKHNQDVGYLRLTYGEKVPVEGKGPYVKIKPSYQYYVSLQPGIWRKELFKTCLASKSQENAWEFEINASKRAKKHRLNSYMVKERAFWFTNFYREGKYYRRQFVDYAIKNNIDLEHRWPVYHRKKLVPFDQYWQESVSKNANISN